MPKAPRVRHHQPTPSDQAQIRPARGGRVDRIDSLRALAMGAVIAQHCKILPFGWIGVWLFYVISGFVVTASLLARPKDETRGRLLGGFYARRAARIWPIYLVYVLAGFLVSAPVAGHLEWPQFASLAFFYNNLQAAFADGTFKGFPVGHLWTISVEFQFYLVFGLAFAMLPRRALAALLVVFLFASPLLRFLGGEALQAAHYPAGRAAFAIYTISPMHFDSFAAGALLALGRSAWAKPGRARALLMVGAAAMVAYACAYVGLNRAHGIAGVAAFRGVISGILIGDERQVWLYSAVAALSAGVLAVVLAGERALAPITEARWLQAVGRVSYGGYVYHMLVVKLVGEFLRLVAHPGVSMAAKLEFGALRFAIAAPLTVGLAMLSYRYVERPIIAAVNRRLASAQNSRDASISVPSSQPTPKRQAQ